MRYAFIMGVFSLALAGCAFQQTYGVPYHVWKTLTPAQQQALADYDQKTAAHKKQWIWQNAAEQSQTQAVKP